MKEYGFSDDLVNVYNLAINKYQNNKNVFLIDIGKKYENQNMPEDLCVRIHSDIVIPNNLRNPEFQFINYNGFGVQQNRNVLPLNTKRTRKSDLIQPGISIGNSVSGTLGLICYDKLNGFKPCLLTAAHVIQGAIGSSVTQPGGGLDRGRSKFDTIGNVLRFDPSGDAGIASLNNRRNQPLLHQFETKNTIISLRRVQIGDVLTKSGRTTGITRAIVDGIGIFFKRTDYSIKTVKGFRLVPLDSVNLEITEISDKGDSGAVWFDSSTNEGLGLLFAGEKPTDRPDLEFSFAQHLTDVFSNLQISLSK